MSAAAAWAAPVGEGAAGVRAAASTTPRRLRMLTALAAAGAGLMWLSGGAAVVGARAEVDLIGYRTVPATIGARQIHAELADADRAAAADFLLGAVETSEPRQEYELDLATAEKELEQAAELNGLGGAATDQLQQVSGLLAQYAGLVEAARASDRPGLPGGVAYLRMASELMQQPGTGILARVDALDGYRPADPAGDVTAKWLLGAALAAFYVLALGLVVLLVYAQVFVRRRFRRRRSSQRMAATAVVTVLAGWMGVAAVSTYRSLGTMESDALPRLHSLWLMRSLAADASADESLTVATRGAGAGFQAQFESVTGQLVDRPLTDQLADLAARRDVRFDGLIATDLRGADEPAEEVDAVRVLRGFQELLQVNAAIKARTAAGDYSAAALLVSNAQLGTATADLDTALQQGIDTEQAQLDGLVASAAPSPLLDLGLGAGAVLVVLLVLWALRPRIAEYTA